MQNTYDIPMMVGLDKQQTTQRAELSSINKVLKLITVKIFSYMLIFLFFFLG